MSETLEDIPQRTREAPSPRIDDDTSGAGAVGARRKRIVIVGGGFAGIAAARTLRRSDADVILIDRRNHHIFQPLLYQAATAVLAPSEIAAPIRQLAEAEQCRRNARRSDGHRSELPIDRRILPRRRHAPDRIRLPGHRYRDAAELFRP